MSTKTVKGDQCIVCSTKFHSRNKALQRTNVFTTIRRRNFTLSDALKLLDVIVSPLKVQQKFCCSSCTIKVRDLYDANQSVTKNRRNIEDVVSPDSYVSSKKLNSNECEFSTPRKGIKRLVDSGFVLPKKRIINPSPPAATHSVYNKRTNKRGNKITVVLKSSYKTCQPIRSLYERRYKDCLQRLFKTIPKSKTALVKIIPQLIQSEVIAIIKSENNPLRVPSRDIVGKLQNFSWRNVINELMDIAPLLTTVIAAALTKTAKECGELKCGTIKRDSVLPLVGSVIGQILYKHRSDLNVLQICNSLLMWLSGTRRTLFQRFNQLHLCTGIKSARKHVDNIKKNCCVELDRWKVTVANQAQGKVDIALHASALSQSVRTQQVNLEQTDLLHLQQSNSIALQKRNVYATAIHEIPSLIPPTFDKDTREFLTPFNEEALPCLEPVAFEEVSSVQNTFSKCVRRCLIDEMTIAKQDSLTTLMSHQENESNLWQTCALLGVNKMETLDDGNCLYDALTKSTGSTLTHAELRKQICDFYMMMPPEQKDMIVSTGHVSYEDVSNTSISKLRIPGYYGGGESYIIVPYVLNSPIRIVTCHRDPTAYVYYLEGQENMPLATITHSNDHFQWTQSNHTGESNTVADILSENDNIHNIIKLAKFNISREQMMKQCPNLYGYTLCFDNVNIKTTTRHQTRIALRNTFNIVQSYAAKDRVPSLHLSEAKPNGDDIRAIPFWKYIPSTEEQANLKSDMKLMIERICVTQLPFFQDLQQDVIWGFEHEHSFELSTKSHVIPLGVLDKDENRTGEMIDILQHYQNHFVPVVDSGNPIPTLLYGDGLSCERAHDAQKARINGLSPASRLDGICPAIQEWHSRLLNAQDFMNMFHDPKSAREKGTAANIRVCFGHKNVLTNTKKCFNATYEFIEFATTSYTVAAALSVMKLETIKSKPSNLPTKKDDKLMYLNGVAQQVVDMIFESTNRDDILRAPDDINEFPWCICKENTGGTMIFCDNKKCPRGEWFHLDCLDLAEEDLPDDEDGQFFCSTDCKRCATCKTQKKNDPTVDHILEYSRAIVFRGLLISLHREAIRFGDGTRMMSLWKQHLLNYLEMNHPKYLIYAVRLLTSINGGLSDRVREQLIWNRTVNTRGVQGKNISMDLMIEFMNKSFKDLIKDSGGQITDRVLQRCSEILAFKDDIINTFDKQVIETEFHNRSHGQPSIDRDVEDLAKILVQKQVFESIPGRAYKSFPGFIHSTAVSDVKKFKKRVLHHQQMMALERDIIVNQ